MRETAQMGRAVHNLLEDEKERREQIAINAE